MCGTSLSSVSCVAGISVVRPRGRRCLPCGSRCPRTGSRRVSGHQLGGGRLSSAPVVVLGRRLPCVVVDVVFDKIGVWSGGGVRH